MNTTESHEAMNRLKVYTAVKIDYYATPAAYILECQAKRIVRETFERIKNEVINGLGYYISVDGIMQKIERSDHKKLIEFIDVAPHDPAQAIVSLIKKRKKC